MRNVEDYQPPPGFQDFPYCWVFDASDLTDSTDAFSVAVAPIQGDGDFILRHTAGVPKVIDTFSNGGRVNFYNASKSYANGNPATGIGCPNNYPWVPEKLYPLNSTIFMDFFQVLKASRACNRNPIPDAFIGFFGVKRLPVGSYADQASNYRWKPFPQRYTFSLTIDWEHFATGTTPAPPHRFIIPMTNLDFELRSIYISEDAGEGALLENEFSIRLYDRQMNATSNLAIPQSYINSARTSPSAAPSYQGVFPVPALMYPRDGAITFDIISNLCSDELPKTYLIDFEGIWRFPV